MRSLLVFVLTTNHSNSLFRFLLQKLLFSLPADKYDAEMQATIKRTVLRCGKDADELRADVAKRQK